jgi:hypothetical protein
MNFQINTYESITNPRVVSTTTINDWLNQIKHSEYSEQIINARLNHCDYNTTKASLPCVTHNFLYNGYKKDTNIINSTGLLYIDIDNPEFNISQLDTSKVFSYYHSFGGLGYAILVKVSGLTPNNFKSTYSNITTALGISDYVDVQAAKASQFNVLSYDSNIFINYDCVTFSAVDAPSSDVNQREKKAYTPKEGAYLSIRFDNLDEIEFDGEYTVNWNGYEYIKCFIPFRKITSKRNNMLLSYCSNLVYLNPTISIKRTISIMQSVNLIGCKDPVGDDQLHRIVKSVHKYLKNCTLKPIYFNKPRKIIFSKSSHLNKDDKLGICRSENAIHKTELSKQKLYDIIEGWDFGIHGNITQRAVYGNRNNHISKTTVEKYWHVFKDLVADMNRDNK